MCHSYSSQRPATEPWINKIFVVPCRPSIMSVASDVLTWCWWDKMLMTLRPARMSRTRRCSFFFLSRSSPEGNNERQIIACFRLEIAFLERVSLAVTRQILSFFRHDVTQQQQQILSLSNSLTRRKNENWDKYCISSRIRMQMMEFNWAWEC